MSTKRDVIRVSPNTSAAIREYAAKKGVTVADAADALIKTAVGRRAAVSKWAAEKAAAEREAKKLAQKQAKRRGAAVAA
jgi:hypothetical protein